MERKESRSSLTGEIESPVFVSIVQVLLFLNERELSDQQAARAMSVACSVPHHAIAGDVHNAALEFLDWVRDKFSEDSKPEWWID